MLQKKKKKLEKKFRQHDMHSAFSMNLEQNTNNLTK